MQTKTTTQDETKQNTITITKPIKPPKKHRPKIFLPYTHLVRETWSLEALMLTV